MLPAVLTNVDHAFAMDHGFANVGYVLAETRCDGLGGISWCGVPLDQQAGSAMRK
jgi:hypothetical protein